METCPKDVRVPPVSDRTAVAADEPGGVVLVDVDEPYEANKVATWLKLKGHRPVLAPWDGAIVEALDVPVVGVVTERPLDLERIASRFPNALRVALVDPASEAPSADFVLPRPFRLDLVLGAVRST